MDIQLENPSEAHKHHFYFIREKVRARHLLFVIEAVAFDPVTESNKPWKALGEKSKVALAPREFASWYDDKEARGWTVAP